MSEFSESYHLYTNNPKEAITLINESGKKGYVFKESNGWVTFVIKGSEFNPDPAIVINNMGILLHYVYAEDHGWAAKIFKGNELVFDYSCEWDEDFLVQKNIFNIEIIKELFKNQSINIDEFERCFEIDSEEELFDLENPPAYQFAENIGLVHFAWISADYVSQDEVPEEFTVID